MRVQRSVAGYPGESYPSNASNLLETETHEPRNQMVSMTYSVPSSQTPGARILSTTYSGVQCRTPTFKT